MRKNRLTAPVIYVLSMLACLKIGAELGNVEGNTNTNDHDQSQTLTVFSADFFTEFNNAKNNHTPSEIPPQKPHLPLQEESEVEQQLLNLAQVDPQAAWQLLESSPSKDEQTEFLVLQKGMQKNFNEFEHIVLQQKTPLRNQLFGDYAYYLASYSYESAVSWLMQINDQDLREISFEKISDALVNQASDEVLDFAVNFPNVSNEIRQNSIVSIFASNPVLDMEEASAKILAIPSSLQVAAITGLINAHASQAPEEVKRWIELLPSGQAKDAAIGAFTDAGIPSSALETSHLINGINNQSTRIKELYKAYRFYKSKSPESAQALLVQITSVSREEIEAIKSCARLE